MLSSGIRGRHVRHDDSRRSPPRLPTRACLGSPRRPRHSPLRRSVRSVAYRHGLRCLCGYSDQVLRDVFDIPGWGIAYVVGLSVLAKVAALFSLLLVSVRWQPLRPRALATLAWIASGVLVLVALWQLVVAVTVESQTYMSSDTALTVWWLAFAPLFAIPALMAAVTWSYAKRHRAWGQA